MAILDAIFNISKRSMMPEWHQLDSSSTMPEQYESTKKKTLKSSSRSFRFSTGLLGYLLIIFYQLIKFEAPSHKSSQDILITKFHSDPLKNFKLA